MTDYYIANSGNDNADGSIGTPWATYAKFKGSVGLMSPGDTVHFNGGDTFAVSSSSSNRWSFNSAWIGNLLNVTSYGSGKPLFNVTGSGFHLHSGAVNCGLNISNIIFQSELVEGDGSGVWLSGCGGDAGSITNCDFVGLSVGVHGASSEGIYNANLTISQCTFTHITGVAGFLGKSSNLIIEDSVFNNCGESPIYDHSIYISGSDGSGEPIDGYTIRRNTIINNTQVADASQSVVIVGHGYMKNVLIEDNHIVLRNNGSYGTGYGIAMDAGYSSPEYFEGLIIRGNILENVGAAGIRVTNASDIEIYNNVMKFTEIPANGKVITCIEIAASAGNIAESNNASVRNNFFYGENAVDTITGVSIAPAVTGVIVNENNELIRYQAPLKCQILNAPALGYLSSIGVDGSFTYVGESDGVDSMTYKIQDGVGDAYSNTADVTLTVAPN